MWLNLKHHQKPNWHGPLSLNRPIVDAGSNHLTAYSSLTPLPSAPIWDLSSGNKTSITAPHEQSDAQLDKKYGKEETFPLRSDVNSRKSIIFSLLTHMCFEDFQIAPSPPLCTSPESEISALTNSDSLPLQIPIILLNSPCLSGGFPLRLLATPKHAFLLPDSALVPTLPVAIHSYFRVPLTPSQKNLQNPSTEP